VAKKAETEFENWVDNEPTNSEAHYTTPFLFGIVIKEVMLLMNLKKQ